MLGHPLKWAASFRRSPTVREMFSQGQKIYTFPASVQRRTEVRHEEMAQTCCCSGCKQTEPILYRISEPYTAGGCGFLLSCTASEEACQLWTLLGLPVYPCWDLHDFFHVFSACRTTHNTQHTTTPKHTHTTHTTPHSTTQQHTQHHTETDTERRRWRHREKRGEREEKRSPRGSRQSWSTSSIAARILETNKWHGPGSCQIREGTGKGGGGREESVLLRGVVERRC